MVIRDEEETDEDVARRAAALVAEHGLVEPMAWTSFHTDGLFGTALAAELGVEETAADLVAAFATYAHVRDDLLSPTSMRQRLYGRATAAS